MIKAPDLSDVDWQACAKHEMERAGLDRKYNAVAFNTHMGFFQDLIDQFKSLLEGSGKTVSGLDRPERIGKRGRLGKGAAALE